MAFPASVTGTERLRPLNFAEACRLARELCGDEHGGAEVRPNEPFNVRCVVGTKGGRHGRRVLGRGSTWEEAFAAAEALGLK